MSIAGQQFYLHVAIAGSAGCAVLYKVENALLSAHHGSKFGENHPTYCREVALALEHARKIRETRLEPVLFAVLQDGVSQIADHLVDRVLKLCDFALGLDCDRTSDISFGNGCSHIRDSAQLRCQRGGKLVDVA